MRKNTNGEEKVKYVSVGTIKTVVLTKDDYAFTLEPISAYRFLAKDDDDSSWKIIFKEESDDFSELKLVVQGAKFTVKGKMADALLTLKQNKSKVEVVVDSASGMDGVEFDVAQITVK